MLGERRFGLALAREIHDYCVAAPEEQEAPLLDDLKENLPASLCSSVQVLFEALQADAAEGRLLQLRRATRQSKNFARHRLLAK